MVSLFGSLGPGYLCLADPFDNSSSEIQGDNLILQNQIWAFCRSIVEMIKDGRLRPKVFVTASGVGESAPSLS